VSRTRFGVIFILLVVILLVVSALFGLLTYWLDAKTQPASTPDRGSMAPMERHPIKVSTTGQLWARPAIPGEEACKNRPQQ
jgi:hypothetical protein